MWEMEILKGLEGGEYLAGQFVDHLLALGLRNKASDIHLEPGGCLLSGGVWCPPPALLKKLRQDIYDHIEEITAIIEEPTFKKTFPVLEGEMLKRMPAGYPMDSPYGYIMKHKDFSVVSYKPDNFFYAKNWMDKAVYDFNLLLPFNRFLNYTVDEYLGRV